MILTLGSNSSYVEYFPKESQCKCVQVAINAYFWECFPSDVVIQATLDHLNKSIDVENNRENEVVLHSAYLIKEIQSIATDDAGFCYYRKTQITSCLICS